MDIIQKTHAFETGIKIGGKGSFANWGEYISTFLNYALDVGMALAILMVLFGGIKYLVSQGNSSTLGDAKEIILGAILGFIVLLLIHYLLKTLSIPIA